MTETFIPSRIVVTAHPKLPDALKVAGSISEYLKGKGIDAPHGSLNDEDLRKQVNQGKFDLLSDRRRRRDDAARRASVRAVRCPHPGHQSRPAGLPVPDRKRKLAGHDRTLLNGEGWIENRMMLRAEHLRSGEIISTWYALNDAVVSRGQFVRPVHLSASVDGLKLATYVADGLIASTPPAPPLTPWPPADRSCLPNCATSCSSRSLRICPWTGQSCFRKAPAVSITVLSENTVLSVDGQTPIGLAEDDHVDVRAGEYTAKFVRFGDPGYFYRNLTAHMNQNPSIGLPR